MKKTFLAGLTIGLLLTGMVIIANADLINVAPLGTASQSSMGIYGGVSGYASNAIDGNTNANWDYYSDTNNSVSHTNLDTHAWWQVKLDQVYDIQKLVIWNRGEYGDRIDDFNIEIANSTNNSTVWSSLNNVAFLASSTVDFISTVAGDIVKIQLNGTNYLQLAEVEVFGTPSSSQENLIATSAPVPEPASMILLGTGLIGFAGTRIRRKKKQS